MPLELRYGILLVMILSFQSSIAEGTSSFPVYKKVLSGDDWVASVMRGQ